MKLSRADNVIKEVVSARRTGDSGCCQSTAAAAFLLTLIKMHTAATKV